MGDWLIGRICAFGWGQRDEVGYGVRDTACPAPWRPKGDSGAGDTGYGLPGTVATEGRLWCWGCGMRDATGYLPLAHPTSALRPLTSDF